jgi:Trypsin
MDRLPDGVRRVGRARLLVVVGLVAAALVGGPLPWSQAVYGPTPPVNPAQVMVFHDNGFGSGTLVDRSWVLTAAHVIVRRDTPAAYTVRLGPAGGQSDRPGLRTIDRIEFPPDGGDLALLHLTTPVPEEVWIATQLATRAPPAYSRAALYGLGPDGVLRVGMGIVYDPAAVENANRLRQRVPEFAPAFPRWIAPMVLDLPAVPGTTATAAGDSGGGVFLPDGTLIGVHSAIMTYRHPNGTNAFYGPVYELPYEQPVWQYRTWIQQIINGEGTSSPPPPWLPSLHETPRPTRSV